MGLFSRQDNVRERTAEERAYARELRAARRQGLPDPEPPWASDGDGPPEVEPVAARLPEPEPEPEPEPDPEPAEVSAPLTWDLTEEWEAVAETPPPHGDPLAPDPPAPDAPAPQEPDDEPEPEPDEETPPHGDPIEPEPEPAAWRPADTMSSRRGGLFRRAKDDPPPARALGRDLPPLPRGPGRPPPEVPSRPRGNGGPPGAPGPARRRHWGRRIAALLALVLVGAAVTLAVAIFQPFHGAGHGQVRVTIPEGSTARQIGDLLATEGVVSNGRLFALRATISGRRGDFKSGGFVLQKDMSYSAAIDKLTTTGGAAPTVRVTIPEGRARGETAGLVRQAGLSGNYLELTRRKPPRALGAPRRVRSLEGFLYPATYEIARKQATASELVREQLQAFRQNIAQVDMRRAKRANLTRFDVITIASMVEREAQLPRERRIIAAVIYNRLHEGIPLSIDATIRFATSNWSRPLTVSELNTNSQYNLRKHTGLPPGPIGSPGLASLQAAANPAHVKYLYYVVKPGTCGAHAFSSTDAQFQRDVSRYNQARAKAGGKSPTKC